MMYHCFASFKQSPLDFFKIVDSRLILMPVYDFKSYNQWGSPISSGLLGSWSEKLKLRGLDCVAYKIYAVLLKDKIGYLQCVS